MDIVKLIIALVVVLIVAGLLFIKNPDGKDKVLKRIGTVVAIAGVLFEIGVTVFTPSPGACLCQGKTDDESIRCVIMTEARAANENNLGLIPKIFNDNAVILRGSDPQQTWTGPLTYYQPAFSQLSFKEASHTDIELLAVRDQTAYYVSGSSGKYTSKDGQTGQYNNPKPSEHWTLSKNSSGCWMINRFEFNAAHLPFTPLK